MKLTKNGDKAISVTGFVDKNITGYFMTGVRCMVKIDVAFEYRMPDSQANPSTIHPWTANRDKRFNVTVWKRILH